MVETKCFLCFILLVAVYSVFSDNIVISVTSTSKEYWVPRVTTTIEIATAEVIQNVLGQLCYIFHRSYEMAKYKENYPCETQAHNLLLYETTRKRRLYAQTNKGTPITLEHYMIKNNTQFLLFYS